MNTVYFNNYNSWKDFSLVLSSHTVDSPPIKTEKVDVPCSNGELDYTEYFGEVKYKNRKIVFTFTTFGRSSELKERLSQFLNVVHGKMMNITVTDDSDFYYVGRVDVKTPTVDKNIMKVQVECDCEPYKYAVQETVIKRTLANESVTLDCTNLKMTVIPTITVVSGTLKITFGSYSRSLGVGAWTDSKVIFREGSNLLTVSGTGIFEVHYQEGGL